MEHRLYEAEAEGNISSLHEVLGEDPEVLDKYIKINCFDETILHVAVLRGHVDFVKEILERNSELAGELDSQLASPLHLASDKGHLEMVKALLLAKPEMCSVLDRDGKNPLHLAAINGRIDVLQELIQTSPAAARTPLNQGKTTIIHLCVQNNQLEVLKLLLEEMNDEEFVNSKDEHGDTVLHLAVADKQTEIVKYLLSSAKIMVNEVNVNGLTALDTLAQSRRDVKDLDIGDSLRQAGALRSKDMSSGNQNGTSRPNSMHLGAQSQNIPLMSYLLQGGTLNEWLMDKRNMLMASATVIGGITSQSITNPPGGVWQDDSPEGIPVENKHKAGEAVMAYNHPHLYAYYYFANLIGFVAALTTILLVTSTWVLRNNFVSVALIVVLIIDMCLATISVLVNAVVSIQAITPGKFQKEISNKIEESFLVLIILLIALVAICFYKRRRLRRGSCLVDVNDANGAQEAPQIQVDINHANEDQEGSQIQVDVNHVNGDQEAPQIQLT